MRAIFDPIAVCQTCHGGTHASRANLAGHAARCHAPISNPQGAGFEWPAESVVRAAGWTAGDFTHWPYGSAPVTAWRTGPDFTVRAA